MIQCQINGGNFLPSRTGLNSGPCVPPSPPVAIAATGVAPGSFSANWNASAGATGYRLDVASDNAFTSFVPGYNDLDVGLALTSLVVGLIELTPYYYRVRAYNGCGTSGNSNTITETTTAWPCGVPSNVIRLTGSLDPGTNQDYVSVGAGQYVGATDPSYTISDSGTQWKLDLTGSGQWYVSSYANFPCVWTGGVGGPDPAPTGQYIPVVWAPASEVATWVDSGGSHSGNLATFQAQADLDTVTSLVFGGTGNLTSLTELQNLHALVTLDVNTNALTTLAIPVLPHLTTVNIRNNASLINFTCPNNTSLVTLDARNCTSLQSLEGPNCTALQTVLGAGIINVVTGINGIEFPNCPALVTFDFPDLVNVDEDLHCPACANIPALESVGGEIVVFDGAVNSAFSAPSLTSVGSLASGYLRCQNTTKVTSISLPVLIFIGNDFDCANSTSIASISVPVLDWISGNLDLSGCANITALSFPSWTTGVGTVNISSIPGLTSWSAPVLTMLGGNTFSWLGDALDPTSIAQILARGVAGGLASGTIDISGGTNAAYGTWTLLLP